MSKRKYMHMQALFPEIKALLEEGKSAAISSKYPIRRCLEKNCRGKQESLLPKTVIVAL